jgi:RNA polymerase sigma factor (sigma-70 family)
VSGSHLFRDLVRRVRAGEQDAAAELVRQYEPAIRRAVRIRLVDARLGRVLDSTDVCQSILGSFFARAKRGQYELGDPQQLLKLLATMARNKVADQVRRQRAGCRDHRRAGAAEADGREVPAPGPTPSQEVAGRELLQKFHERLSPEERHLAGQRALGRDWAEIGADCGESPEALRKRLDRAIGRVAQALRLQE